MRTILSIIRKEFLQIRRDRRMMIMILVSPVVQLLILGYAANLDVSDIPAAVCDQDRTPASRGFLAEFFNSGYFRETARVAATADIDALLESGRASIAFVVPAGFGRDLAAGRPAAVQTIVDGSESMAATIGLNYAAAITARYARGVLLEAAARRGAALRPVRVDPEVRVWYNPALTSLNFMVPAVLGLVLMVMTMMLTSLGLVREKEAGTLEQLIVTPIRPAQLMTGKLAPFALIGLVEITIAVAIAVFWFRVPLRGSPLLLYLLSGIFMLSTLGLGLFISTVSHNQQQAMLTAIFFMIPFIILSGFVFPIENMPRGFRIVTAVIPMRYFFTVIRGLFLKGVGLGELWDEGAAMLAFGAIILGLSVLRFRKRLK